MPKLNATKAKEVAAATRDVFALPEGRYIVKLTDCSSGNSKSGKPMWTWIFRTVEALDIDDYNTTDPEGDEYVDPEKLVNHELRYFSVIQDNTLWDLARIFAAFDADTDTDTEELVNEEIGITVSRAIIGAGKLKGQTGNEINEFHLATDLRSEVATQYSDTKKDDDPDF